VRKLYLVLLEVIIVVIYALPVVWMYLSATRTNPDFIANPLGLPEQVNFSNFIDAYQMAEMTRHFGISILVTVLSTGIVLFFGSLAAFSFSRLRYRYRNAIFGLFFVGLILPIQSFLVGLFVLFRGIGLLNTIWAMVLPTAGIGMPIAILIMKYYFDALPTSLEESAYIDGASSFLVYRAIVMPISSAIVVTVIIFTAINVWNEFLIPFVMVQSQRIRPLTTSLYVFSTRYAAQFTLKLAALSIIATPMFVVYFFFQRQVQEGITAGALKG